MQGIPPNNQNPRGGSPGFRMNTNQPPRPLQVQQSRLAPQGRPAVQNQRIPAVSTLKAGGPRLAPVPPAKTAKKKKKRNPADVRDYLFGLVAGLIIFGIAAIFVCGAVIDMFVFI